MSGLDVLLAVAGLAATALVVAGMILLTPRGTAELSRDDTPEPFGTGAQRPQPDGQRPVPAGRALDRR